MAVRIAVKLSSTVMAVYQYDQKDVPKRRGKVPIFWEIILRVKQKPHPHIVGHKENRWKIKRPQAI